ncbi:MAG: efflux RND transporter permease subunit [Fibrobacter sp.]|nr:efflux RND transporter permease subunit [Fibrobacter sp.]
MNTLFTITLRNRLLIVLSIIAVLAFGAYHYRNLATDAFPDISPVMVPIFAEVHGMAPEEVERLITFPIESAMNGLPGVKQVKSTSAFGMAVIYVYFNDNVDMYFARQLIAERLSSAELPELEERPSLGPISSGLGEVFMYYLAAGPSINTGGKDTLSYLREVNDWIVKYQLQSVQGVTEILSMGGYVSQYQVKVNPDMLTKYGVTLDEVISSITSNNRNTGGQFIVIGAEEYLVRGLGLYNRMSDLKLTQIKTIKGIPVRIGDIADVVYGKETRRGVVTLNGTDEVVAGIVMKLYGTNTSKVIEKLNKKIPDLEKSLPPGVKLVPYYSQDILVGKAISTVTDALWQGGLLVILVLIVFLGNIRSAFIVALSFPICAMIAFIAMGISNMSANLMSLGGIAIAIGMLGDASIVIVENIYRHVSEGKYKHRSIVETIISAGNEVARPIVFSVGIIIIVFLPILTLEGVEGKMFKPMAYTIIFALAGSLVAAMLFAPVLSSLLIGKKITHEMKLLVLARELYKKLLQRLIRFKVVVIIVTCALFILSLILIPKLGTEFIPTLEEGAIQLNVTMAPSISLEKATETIMKIERIVKEYDEVDKTIGKIGRPEAGSHPHPVNTAHIQMMLKPENEWKQFRSKQEIVEAINGRLKEYPGIQLNFSQPIQNMFDELLSGVKTQLAIKVHGDDIMVLKGIAEEIKEYIEGVDGLVDLATEQSYGQPQIQINVDRDACARYGVNVDDILTIVEVAIGGEVVDQVFLEARRFGIEVRYDEHFRSTKEEIENILVTSADGLQIPLSQVAHVNSYLGPIQINREDNQRRWNVTANVRGRDLGSVVEDIRTIIDQKIKLPAGYHIVYGGQFENQQRAMKRLGIIVPIALTLIFLMLFISLKSLKSAALIYVNVPLALIGGILGLYFTNEYLSVPAAIGFIALFGIAVQNGLVLVSYINQLRDEGVATRDAVLQACSLRLRPVLMTAFTTVLGLIPMLFSSGIGAEVQRPLATVVVYGLISSTFLTLVLIPVLYEWFAPKVVVDTTSAVQKQ